MPIAFVMVLLLIQAIANLYLPELNADIINNGVAKGDIDYIIQTGGLMLVVTFALMIAAVIGVYWSARIAMGFGRDVRSGIFRKVETFSQVEVNQFGAASLITRNTNDVTQVQTLVLMALNMMITAPIMMIGGVIMAYRQDPPLTAILLVIIPIMLLLIGSVMKRAIPLFQAMQKKLDRINLVMRETLTGVRVIRAFVRTEHEEERFDVASRDLMDTGLRVNRLFAITMPSLMLIMNLSTVAVLWLGAYRVDSGEMPIGNLTAFLQYITLILFSMMTAVIMFVMVPRAAVSAGRIHEVLETVPSIGDPDAPVSPRRGGQVEFRDVTFGYPGAEEPVLRNVSFTASPGETVAIVGSTGSGKTTLINLLPRFYDVTGGTLLVDGVDVRTMDRQDLWRRIGMVPQKAFLFSGTIASNLRSATRTPRTTRCGATWTSPRAASSWPRCPRARVADRAGRHQRVGRAAPAARDREGARETARDLRLRRQLLRAGLPDRCAPAGRAGPGAGRRDGDHRRPARRHHPPRRPDRRPRGRRGRGDRHPRRADADLRDLPRDRPVPGHRGGGRMSGPMGRPGGAPGGGPGGGGPRPGGGPGPGGGPPHMGMMMPTAKAADFRASFTRLLGELRPERILVGIVVALGVVSVFLAIIGPKILGEATNVIFNGIVGKQLGEMGLAGVPKDEIVAGLQAQGQTNFADMLANMDVVAGVGIDFALLAQILLFATLVYTLSSIFSWGQAYIMAGVTQRTVYRLRRRVDEKLGRLPLAYFDRESRGDILSRVTNDIDNISQTLQQSLTQLITAMLTVVGVLIMMLTISPLLAVISLLVVPASVLVTVIIAKRSQKQFAAQWERTGTLNGHIEEMHTGHAIVKLFGRQEEAIEVFDRENELLYEASYRAQFMSGMIQPAMTFISNLNYVAICVIGGIQVANGQMSLGDVQAFIQYSRQFTMPIIQVASIANVLQTAVASAERVFELLDEAEEIPDPVAPTILVEPAAGRVTFEDIAFRYVPDKPLIEDLSLVVEPGQTVAIVGPDRGRQDHARQPADALLRRGRRPDHRGRHRDPGADPRQPAPDVRDGPPGRVAVQGHDPREHGLRRRRAR